VSHTITVTRPIDTVYADEPEYSTGGSCDHSCSVWYPCKVDGCTADDEGEFHGQWHCVIGGIEDYCTQGSGCGLDYAYGHDNPEQQMIAAGIYDVDVEWDGDHWLATLNLRESQDSSSEGADRG